MSKHQFIRDTRKSQSLLQFPNGKEGRVDSRLIAREIEIQHRNLMALIYQYQDRLEHPERGHLLFKTQMGKRKQGGGKPEPYALLNEAQAGFLLTLSKNTPPVVEFKDRLTLAFNRLRKQAERRATLEWQQARLQGKVARKTVTDAQQKFIEYAKANGSENADRYYSNFVRMENAVLGFPQEKGIRDRLDTEQLTTLATAEYLEAKAIDAGVLENLSYKEIFLLAKYRVKDLAAVLSKRITAQ